MKCNVSSIRIVRFFRRVGGSLAFCRLGASAHWVSSVAYDFSSRNFYFRNFRQPRAVAMVIIVAAIGASSSHAMAARVSGVLTRFEDSTPLVSRDLHFQNIITGDIYLSPTHSDGSFGASLPPGTYRLRTETGAILVRSIGVSRVDINIGRISELAPLAPQRLWQAQRIAPTILTSAAPSTAYLMTADTTILPATATPVRKPQIDWSKPPPETQAAEVPNMLKGTPPVLVAPEPPPAARSAGPQHWMGGAPYIPPLAAPGTSTP